MSRHVSVAGKWHPAKEVVQLPLSQEDLLAGKNPVYIGPDRSALAMMVEQGYCTEDPAGDISYSGDDPLYIGKKFKIQDYPGRDCFTDPDVIRMARTLGYKNVEDYLDEMFGVKKKDVIAKANSLVGKIVQENKTIKADASGIGGGEDRSGQGHNRKGGFGDPNDVQPGALKQRA